MLVTFQAVFPITVDLRFGDVVSVVSEGKFVRSFPLRRKMQ
jgi:hypothetical protein